MPTSVAGQSIAPLGIAPVSVATGFNASAVQEPFLFPPGSYSFKPPKAGYWKFVGWGPGGVNSSTSGGGSGAYIERTLYLRTSDVVTLSVGHSLITIGAQANTSLTEPGGRVVTAGGASGATGGTATNGDVNLNGSAGLSGGTASANGAGTGGGLAGVASGGNSGGAGAPANLPYRGGAGGTGNGGVNASGASPGGGMGQNSSTAAGGDGLMIATLVRS